MNAIEKIIPYYTYEDYKLWEGKWELIDGLPFAMVPSPVYNHQLISSNLLALFWNALQSCKHCKVLQPLDYIVTDDTVLQPDLLIICGEMKKKFLDFPPALVCEVISPSTALKDRHTKLRIYQTQKIPYYILISPITQEAEVYVLQEGEYVLNNKGGNFIAEFKLDECDVKIDFANIWE